MKSPGPHQSRTSNINLQAMEVFCEVVRLQSFSRGGGTFGISQSGTSQIIAHLEDELDSRLFDRKRRPLRLTPTGERYHETCLEILHRHRITLNELDTPEKSAGGTVRVTSIYSVGLHSLNPYIQRFIVEQPDSRVHLEYLHPSKVYAAVANEEAELGVVSYPRPARNLKIIPWIEEEMVLACPQGHELAARKSLELSDLGGQKFVAFDLDLTIRREIDRALRARSTRVEITSAFDNVETIKQALEVSGAVSILPKPAIQKEVERGVLIEVALKGTPLSRPVGIVHNQKRTMGATAELFIQTLLSSP